MDCRFCFSGQTNTGTQEDAYPTRERLEIRSSDSHLHTDLTTEGRGHVFSSCECVCMCVFSN